MSQLFLCNVCGEHHTTTNSCHRLRTKPTVAGIALTALLGLTACGDTEDKDTANTGDTSVEDTDTSDTVDTAVDTAVAVMYGVPEDTGMWVDNDEDGYTPSDGDCDDNNPEVHPDAPERPGDGVDSNCNGDDDT